MISETLDQTNLSNIPSVEIGAEANPQNDTSDGRFDREQEKMFDFSEAKIHLSRLVNDWSGEIDETKRRRKVRKINLNVNQLRDDKKLDPDETLIPVRTIETNITREQPPLINYLINSRRLCIFTCLSDPKQDTQLLETEFTRGMTYTKWVTPFHKCFDGAQTHGSACVEVVYDSKKPLNVGIEYIPHEELLYPRSVRDIQDAPRIIRTYSVTLTKLKKWVREFDFDQEQVSTLVRARQSTQKEIETVIIYKLLFKKEGIVYVAWFSLEHGVADWLKKPTKLYLGIEEKVTEQITEVIQSVDPISGISTSTPSTKIVESYKDTDIEMYPVFLLQYKESEEVEIAETKGRVFLDENKQEAQTAILSAFVNGLTRASNIYGSPKTEDGTGSSLKELDLPMKGGRIFSKPLDFWAPPYPDFQTINALNYFDTANSQETNQVNFAAINRQDSRKTAKEMAMAENEQTMLNSVTLTLFSTFVREIYSLVWRIVQSQATRIDTTTNKPFLNFLLVERERVKMSPVIPNQPLLDEQTGQPITEKYYENDFDVISKKYEIRAAGDVDVIQRLQKIAQMKQDWPVISNTPLKDRFLADLMKLQYPDVGEAYAKELEKGSTINIMQSMIARLGTVLNGFIQQHPEDLNTMNPDSRNQLTELMNQAQQFIAPANNSPK